MSLNIIGKCALGMDLDAFNNRNHPIREAAEELLGQSILNSWSDSALFQFFFVYFPELQHVINMWPSGYKTIWKVSNDIIKVQRRKLNMHFPPDTTYSNIKLNTGQGVFRDHDEGFPLPAPRAEEENCGRP